MLFIDQEESITYKKEIEAKMIELNEILNNYMTDETRLYGKLAVLCSDIDQIEGLKTNLELSLNNVKYAIEMYEEIMGMDDNLKEIKSIYACTIDSLKKSTSQRELLFPQLFKRLNEKVDTLREVLESNGLSSRLLFKNSWQSEDVVEFYVDPDEEEWYFENVED